ncbi:hypothetical protein Gotri_022151 [Gossypium trilobum]|uniref:Uncharacterized protein n=1 Tax=Gossypium trilobum TaxID=34281 RepID=A0A7J9DES2_9ROSI|nr:hypothetical protein [Gossypium trilobum]
MTTMKLTMISVLFDFDYLESTALMFHVNFMKFPICVCMGKIYWMKLFLSPPLT